MARPQSSLYGTVGLLMLACAAAVCAQQPSTANNANGRNRETGIDLRPAEQTTSERVVSETVVETVMIADSWDIDAPVRLQAADPQEPCSVQLFTMWDYSTSSDGTDDDIDQIFRAEWGFMKNHHLSIDVPVRLGDGGYEGNADITLGWQWLLWDELEALPAFAIINELRVPNGYQSEGVDWKLTGALTKSIVENCLRLHVNPFLKTVNGENLGWESSDRDNHPGDPRHFQWGIVAGVDWKLNECLILVADYIHETSTVYGWRNQHSAEVGLEWKLSENQMLGTSTYCTLDGDDFGPNWGMRFNYAYTIGYGH